MAGMNFSRLAPLRKPLRWLGRQLPPLNFITIHYIYFLATCLGSAIIFWGSSTPARSVSFTDSLFLTVSAMTLAGLNTINLSTLNTFQQFLLFLLIMLGSAIFVSGFIVQVRRRAFEKKFGEVEAAQRETRGRGRTRSRSRWTLGRASTEIREGDVEAANEKDKENVNPASKSSDASDENRNADANGGIQNNLERELTPPERRGGPEMNPNPGMYDATISDSEEEASRSHGITFQEGTRFQSAHPTYATSPQSIRRRRSSIFTMQGVGARPSTSIDMASPVHHSLTFERGDALPARRRTYGDISKYFHSNSGWISRNSQFHGLTEKEREKLGGCEYRAISLLAWLVPAYFVLWQLFGCIGCAAWVAVNQPDTAWQNGINPWWVGAFNAVSAFNNSGMSLLDANMTAFQTSYYLLITMSLLILAGNTCYPVFLRGIVWSLWRGADYFHKREPASDFWTEYAATLRFLLDHPRRCYTNLFPSQHTRWLLGAVIILNGIDWAAFEILNINNSALDTTLPINIRVIDGLFQAFAVRSGGFYVVAIPTLRISLQVLYVVMMYISAYPVLITMRSSNVYEERSLGIYADDAASDDENASGGEAPLGGTKGDGTTSARTGPGFLKRAMTLGDHLVVGGANYKESNGHFVRQQLRAQLAHDAWWIVLAVFLIMIVENSQFVSDPVTFSVFNFIFEIVSAYGCVGISVGVPWAAYSFCGTWHALSKLILCAVMLRGRHRGLPVAIDQAVLLPGEENWWAEEEDGRIRMARTMSRGREGYA